MPILIIGALIAGGYFYLKSKQPVTAPDVYQPTYTNTPTPVSTTSRPTQVRHTVVRRAPARRDLNPQFPSRSDLALAIKLNPDPRHLIPHMYAQEGNAIKYVDIRGGSNTMTIAQLKAAKGIK